MDFEEEIKKRAQMVYVPNWFSVDIKTGVSIATSILVPRSSISFGHMVGEKFPAERKKTRGPGDEDELHQPTGHSLPLMSEREVHVRTRERVCVP